MGAFVRTLGLPGLDDAVLEVRDLGPAAACLLCVRVLHPLLACA